MAAIFLAMAEENLVDLTFLNDFCKGNKLKMIAYIHTFLESAPAQLNEINNFNEEMNLEKLRSAIHSFKPQLTFIGLNSIHTILESIEVAAHNSGTKNTIRDLIIDLNKKMEEATQQLIEAIIALS